MTELLTALRTAATVGSKPIVLLGILLLGAVVVNRGRRAAALEQAEDSRERRAA